MVNENLIKLAELVKKMMTSCRLCPRNCKVNRNAGETGFCGIGQVSKLCKELVHYAEEPGLVPTYSVYFAGCNMRCEYCSNFIMLNPAHVGESVEHSALAARVDHALLNGSKTIFFLGGEPACSLRDVILTMAYIKSTAPVVWNSNMYISPEAFELVLQISDIFLADIKFGCDKCAIQLANTPEYLKNVRRNIILANNAGKPVIIRHLALAGHVECCTRPVLEWVAANCPEFPVSILELMPTENTSLQSPSSHENELINAELNRLGLKKIHYTINHELPRVNIKTRTVESILHIRRDGSIAVQDTTGEIIDMLNKI
ncbi:MAG: radical SAM protein [Victivallaceae bacterium]